VKRHALYRYDFIHNSQITIVYPRQGFLVGEGGEAGDLRDSGGGYGDGRWEMGDGRKGMGKRGWEKGGGQGLSVMMGRKGGAGLGLKRNPNWLMGLGKRVRVGFSDK